MLGLQADTEFTGASSVIKKLNSQLAKAAVFKPRVLLLCGPTGSGKELAARHYFYKMAGQGGFIGKFVPVNCSSIPPDLLESTLFGHEANSFTGAGNAGRPGIIETAKKGVLFLDEIGKANKRVQASLLRFLDTGEIRRVGAVESKDVDLNVVLATNEPLEDLVEAGELYRDFFWRISAVQINIPPLCERKEDIPALVSVFFEKLKHEQRLDSKLEISQNAIDFLASYSWPGNVRQLANAIERAAFNCSSSTIGITDFGFLPTQGTVGAKLRQTKNPTADRLWTDLVVRSGDFEEIVRKPLIERKITKKDVIDLIDRALAETRGNYKIVQRKFGLSNYKALLNFLETHNCKVDFRPYRQAGAGENREIRILRRRQRKSLRKYSGAIPKETECGLVGPFSKIQ